MRTLNDNFSRLEDALRAATKDLLSTLFQYERMLVDRYKDQVIEADLEINSSGRCKLRLDRGLFVVFGNGKTIPLRTAPIRLKRRAIQVMTTWQQRAA